MEKIAIGCQMYVFLDKFGSLSVFFAYISLVSLIILAFSSPFPLVFSRTKIDSRWLEQSSNTKGKVTIKRAQREFTHYAERENGRMKFNRYFLLCEIDEVTADCNIGF